MPSFVTEQHGCIGGDSGEAISGCVPLLSRSIIGSGVLSLNPKRERGILPHSRFGLGKDSFTLWRGDCDFPISESRRGNSTAAFEEASARFQCGDCIRDRQAPST